MLFGLDILDMRQQVINRAQGQLAEGVTEIMRQFHNMIQARASEFTAANERAAIRAQNATVKSYRASLNANRMSGYRANAKGSYKRYTGGVLEAALADPAMYYVDNQSVSFINTIHLDNKAKQWYRLNFGTGGGRNVRKQTITFMDVALPMPDLRSYTPSDPFRIPKGFFLGRDGQPVDPQGSRRGQDAFTPIGYYLSRGVDPPGVAPSQFISGVGHIDARRFLDDGVRVLNREFFKGQEKVLKDIADESLSARGGRGARVFFGGSHKFVRVKTWRDMRTAGIL